MLDWRGMILIVEDNEDDAALALRAFRKHEPEREIHGRRRGNGIRALEFLHGKEGERAGRCRIVLLIEISLASTGSGCSSAFAKSPGRSPNPW